MKKLLLCLMLFTVNSSVMAEWELVLKTKESTQYVDRTTLRVSGNIAKMWTLTNISKRIESIKQGELALAMKSLSEYDCEKKRTRVVSAAFYREYMGTGGIVSSKNTSTPDSDWMQIVPGQKSIFAICWKIACGKEDKE